MSSQKAFPIAGIGASAGGLEHGASEAIGSFTDLIGAADEKHNNKVDGVVVVLPDIDEIKRSEHEAKTQRDYIEGILRAAPVPFLVLRGDLRVRTASESFYRQFKVTPGVTEGRLVYEIGNGQWDIPALRILLEDIIPRDSVFNDYEVTHHFPDIGRRIMLLNARRVDSALGLPEHILLAIADITDIRQTEEMQARLSAIVSSADDGILSKTLDGVVTTWNASAERIFGYTAEEIIGNPSLHLTPPDLLHEEEYILKEILAGKPVEHFDTQRMTKDGRRLLVSLTISPIKDATGKVVGASKIVRDITGLKQAEAALRESEERYRALFASVPVAVFVCDRDAVIQQHNPRAVELWGRAPQCGVERHCGSVRLFLPDGTALPHAQSPVVEVLRTGVPALNVEVSIERPDGSRLPVLVNFAALKDAQGEITGAVTSFIDIAERTRIEGALRESESRKTAILDGALDAIITMDHEGRVVDFNPAAESTFGIARADIIGQSMAEKIIPERLRGGHNTGLASYLETGDGTMRKKRIEVPALHADGHEFTIELSITRISGAEPPMFTATLRDITERIQAEESLRRAMEEVERASRAKDDFLAALSHELRTPLTPVLMTATALEHDPALPQEVREQLAMMGRNITLEARLIDDLLDITRISRGKLSIALVTADLHELLNQTDEIIRSDGLGKQVRITFALEAVRHHALVDPGRLQQVFWNLIKNALKFTPTGGCINVSTNNDATDNIIVRFEDTGIGISAEALPDIFGAFEQGDVAGQHRYGGLGMGLAISQAIMDAHGGKIHAESPGRGRGAVFTVTLGTVDAPPASEHKSVEHPAHLRALRLLIVEDHETTRAVLQRLLTLSGHEVTTAASVQEALAAYAATHFDVVISDLGLPDGSGLDLMRAIQRLRPVPAIALSGYGMEDDLRQTREAGFSAHLVKPVNLDQLRQLIDQIPPSSP